MEIKINWKRLEGRGEMNREIKFRAWHTELKRMFSAEEMGQDELTISVDGRGFVNVNSVSIKLSIYAGDKMIPIQFTGLLDKTGKEIYEGDIVTFNGNMTADNSFGIEPNGYIYDGTSIHSIIWNNKMCGWDLNFQEDDEWKYKRDTRGLFIGLTEDNKENEGISFCEIIGNIYENPELLESK